MRKASRKASVSSNLRKLRTLRRYLGRWTELKLLGGAASLIVLVKVAAKEVAIEEMTGEDAIAIVTATAEVGMMIVVGMGRW